MIYTNVLVAWAMAVGQVVEQMTADLSDSGSNPTGKKANLLLLSLKLKNRHLLEANRISLNCKFWSPEA